MIGLLIVALAFAILAIRLADVHTTLSFTSFDSPGIGLGRLGWIALAVFMIAGTTNGVNLSDGLDGLAAGSAALCFSAFVVIGFWEFRHIQTYQIPQALDLALVAAAMMGACTGFLWWNAAPATIIMGDVGSLGIGAGLAALALVMSTQLLLAIAGALYVIETLSVMVQVSGYKLTKKRILKMSPIHHHFEMVGWEETTVTIRFWIFAAMCTALALGIFYATFITNGGID
jgi:phospho-N-acetylmuramoyl-pentapeptide-transferase